MPYFWNMEMHVQYFFPPEHLLEEKKEKFTSTKMIKEKNLQWGFHVP